MKRHPNNRNFWKFFDPFMGKHYADGINKKKILVLTSRIYCDNESCPFFFHCTSVLLKHSLPYEKKCPRHKSTSTTLRQEPKFVIEKGSRFLRQIAAFMGEFLNTVDYNTIWQSMAFTCYNQFMYPANNGIYPEMRRTELSQDDFNAFIEVVQELRPNIIVVRDNVVSTRLMEQNSYIQSLDELVNTHHYICHLNIPNMDYPIAVIRYSPSFDLYFRHLLNS